MDPRFVPDCDDKAESSKPVGDFVLETHNDLGTGTTDGEEDPAECDNTNESDNGSAGLGDGMDPGGFAGPSEKVVKPLTPEALAAFNAAQKRTGVVYISRIPPGMQPPKVRHLMSAFGEIGRVYLQQEGVLNSQ